MLSLLLLLRGWTPFLALPLLALLNSSFGNIVYFLCFFLYLMLFLDFFAKKKKPTLTKLVYYESIVVVMWRWVGELLVHATSTARMDCYSRSRWMSEIILHVASTMMVFCSWELRRISQLSLRVAYSATHAAVACTMQRNERTDDAFCKRWDGALSLIGTACIRQCQGDYPQV